MRLHLYPLDAVRFFAALSVMSFHLVFYTWAAPGSMVGHMFGGAASYPPLAPFTWFGWVGVEIFFVISGFVIANSANSSSPIKFVKSRALRLYPAVWFCALITFAASIVLGGAHWQELLGKLARSLSLWVAGPWIDAVYWTLAVEMMFYLLIFVLLMRRGFAKLPIVAMALVIGPTLYLGVSALAGDALSNFAAWRMFSDAADLLLFRHGSFFAVGVFMWLWSMRGLKSLEWAMLAIGAGTSCLEVFLRARHMTVGEIEAPVDMPLLVPVAVWLAAVVLMFVFASAPERFAPRSKTVQGLLQHVGKMTYPLYLIHALLGAGLLRVTIQNGVTPWLALPLVIAAMLALASFISEFAEPAIRKLLRGMLDVIEKGLRRAPALAFLFEPGGAVAAKAAAPSN